MQLEHLLESVPRLALPGTQTGAISPGRVCDSTVMYATSERIYGHQTVA